MDSKRPDVRLDEKPEEDGVVTGRDDEKRDRSLVSRLLKFFKR
ncbi:hypothetical protein [Halomontanus rarus]|nr:hypothetical protein [Halovivax sp. TS33]